MTRAVRCSTCGPVTVDPSTVEVHVNHTTGFTLFAFICTDCGGYEVGGCADTGRRLLDQGARAYELRSTADPAFTLDDVIALREWLETEPDWAGPADDRGVPGEH